MYMFERKYKLEKIHCNESFWYLINFEWKFSGFFDLNFAKSQLRRIDL